MSSDDTNDLSLIMPFVVCEGNGGPYNDEAFVAGYTAGVIDAALHSLEHIHAHVTWWVPSKLVPQLDLLAMRYRFSMEVNVWEEDPETSMVTFGPPHGEDDE